MSTKQRHTAAPVVSSTMLSSSGFDAAEKELLERWFEGHDRVIDADRDIDLVVLAEDLIGAVPCHPERCVIAQAAQRAYDSDVCLVYGRVAYLARPDEDGAERLYRYELSGKTLERRDEFDATGAHPTGVTIVLKAPKPSNRLEYRREQQRRERAEGKKNRSGETTSRSERGDVLRSGQGCVVTRMVSAGFAETDLRVARA